VPTGLHELADEQFEKPGLKFAGDAGRLFYLEVVILQKLSWAECELVHISAHESDSRLRQRAKVMHRRLKRGKPTELVDRPTSNLSDRFRGHPWESAHSSGGRHHSDKAP
jgi:hypothetical protein